MEAANLGWGASDASRLVCLAGASKIFLQAETSLHHYTWGVGPLKRWHNMRRKPIFSQPRFISFTWPLLLFFFCVCVPCFCLFVRVLAVFFGDSVVKLSPR